jgi:hypothetical protein
MKLLQQHELRLRGSHYFRPERTTPFMVSFLHALVALKRLGKALKHNVMKVRGHFNTRGRPYLNEQISKVTQKNKILQYSGTAIYMADIKPPVREEVVYRNRKTGKVYESAEEAMKAQAMAVKKARLPEHVKKWDKIKRKLKRIVAERVFKYQQSVALGKHEDAEERLLKKFDKEFPKNQYAEGFHHHHSHSHKHGASSKLKRSPASDLPSSRPASAPGPGPSSPTSRADELLDPAAMRASEEAAAAQALLDAKRMEEEESRGLKMVEYPPGTGIYYSSTVYLQAKHGGYLSVKGGHVSTAAFKVTKTSKYNIVKATDPSSKSAVCYGDSVLFMCGDQIVVPGAAGAGGGEGQENSQISSSLVGAAFFGTATAGEKDRRLEPQVVGYNLENYNRAVQYGRWIVLHKDNPVEMTGKPVMHMDHVLLEQEWYYLSSFGAGACSLFRLKVEIEDVVAGKVVVDLLAPGEECGWRIGLFGLGSNSTSNENKLAVLNDKAARQMKESGGRRKRIYTESGIMMSLEERLDPRLSMNALKEGWIDPVPSKGEKIRALESYALHGWTGHRGPLHFKQSEYLNQKHLIRLYSDMSVSAFSRQPSVDFIRNLYGKDSLIYKKKKEVLELRANNIGITRPPIRVVEVSDQTALDEYEDDYWDVSEALRLPVEVWAQLQGHMKKWHRVDDRRKMTACIVIQKAVRRWLRNKYHFGRKFDACDREARAKWHKYFLNRRRRLLFDEIDEGADRGLGSGTKGSSTFLTASASAFSSSSSAAAAAGEGAGGARGGEDETYASLEIAKREEPKSLAPRLRASQSMYVKESKLPGAPRGGAALPYGKRGSMPNVSLEALKSFSKGNAAAAPEMSNSDTLSSSSAHAAGDGKLPLLASPVRAAPPSAAAAPPPTLSPEQVKLQRRREVERRAHEEVKARLSKASGHDFGLPADVFNDAHGGMTVRSSIKFLRSFSGSELYKDVKSTKRGQGSSKAREGGKDGSAKRPQTAFG